MLRNVRSVDRLSFYEQMLADIVYIAKSSLSRVQFASIFLSIARQLEHYHLEHLFPLLYQKESSLKYITVEDLFNTAVAEKSLPIASSSLPIFEDTDVLHNYCLDLLHHCLTSVLSFVSAEDSSNLWCMREECYFLQQIYNYTVKIEDSFEAQSYHYEDSFDSKDKSSEMSDDGTNKNNYDMEHSYFADPRSDDSACIDSLDSDASYAEIIIDKNQTPSRIRRFASSLTPSLFKTNATKDDEHAIAEAASTFVRSGFGEESFHTFDTPSQDFGLMSIDESVVHSDSNIINDASVASSIGNVGDILGKVIAHCLFNVTTEQDEKCWNGMNQIAVICCLLQSSNNDRLYELENAIDSIEHIRESTVGKVLVLFNKVCVEGGCAEYIANDNIDNAERMEILLKICERKWSVDDASAIFDVMVSTLARFKPMSNDSSLLSILALLAAISCHISQQTDVFFNEGRTEESYIGRLLKRVIELHQCE